MDLMIRSLTLKGFRSFASATVEFDNPTFLVGPNGSGKSNLVDAFTFLAEAVSQPLRRAIETRGGFSQLATRAPHDQIVGSLSIRVELAGLSGSIHDGEYSFAIQGGPDSGFVVSSEGCRVRDRKGKTHFFERLTREEPGGYAEEFASSETWLKPTPEPGSLLLPLIGDGIAVFKPILQTLTYIEVCSINPAALRRDQLKHRRDSPQLDGSDTAYLLLDLQSRKPEELIRVEEFMAAMLPYRIKISAVEDGQELSLKFALGSRDGEISFGAGAMSDGTLRALGIIAALFQRNPPSLIVVEEPEASIHPHALGVILDALQLASRRMQVVVTTHSPDVLDAKWIEDRHLRLVTWDGSSRATPVSDASRAAIRQQLMGAGELLRANALEPPDRIETESSETSALRG